MRFAHVAVAIAALAACNDRIASTGETCQIPSTLEDPRCKASDVCIVKVRTTGHDLGTCWPGCADAGCQTGCSCGTIRIVTPDGGQAESALHCLDTSGATSGCNPAQ